MQEIDMSRPGVELFPESSNVQHNSYTDVNMGQAVDDPLNTGVAHPDVAGQVSQKEFNFGALREEVAKMKEEREYWKGQAEAYSKIPTRHPVPEASQQDAYAALDLEDAKDVRKAFEAIRDENQTLRSEIK